MPILTVHLDRIENLADEDHIGKVRPENIYLFDFFCAAIFWFATNQWSISKITYCQHCNHISTLFHSTYTD